MLRRARSTPQACSFLCKGAKRTGGVTDEPGQARQSLGGRQQPVLLEMGVHLAEIEHHPVGQEPALLLFPGLQIVAPIGDRAAEGLAPGLRRRLPRPGLGANDVVRFLLQRVQAIGVLRIVAVPREALRFFL